MTDAVDTPMRPVIVGTLVLCLAVAVAPWFSGGQEPVAMLVSVGALLLGSLLAWRQPGVRQLKRGPLVVAFAVLIGFALLSLLWSANRYSTAVWVTQWVMAGLAFRLAYVVAGEAKGKEWMVRAYLVSVGLFCVSALWIYLTSPYDRLTGTFYWPNPAAVYLIPAIVLCVDRLRRASGRAAYVWVGAGSLLVATFLLTDSRATSLVLLLVMILYLLVSGTKRIFWIRLVFSIAVGTGLSFGLIFLSTLTVQHSLKVVPGSRLAQAAAGQSQSLSDRVYYLESAFDMWLAHPIGGTGAGTYGDVHPQYQRRVVSASTSAHNVYVQTLSELGLVGALVLAWMLLALFTGVLAGLVAAPELLPLALGAAGLLLHFGLDIDATYPALLMLVAVLVGLVYRQRSSVRHAASLRWPAVAVLLLVPVTSLYQSESWAVRAEAVQSDGDYSQAAVDYAAAHRGLVYNPDYVNAEGIDFYTVANGGGTQARTALALALDRARQAQRLDPHDGQHHQLEGRVLALQGDLPAAEGALKQALKLDPYNHPEYALDLASVQLLAHDPVAAERTAETMLSQYPDAVVSNRNSDLTLRPTLGNLEALVGNVRLAQGDLTAAKTAASRSLEYDPGNLRGRALAHQLTKPVPVAAH